MYHIQKTFLPHFEILSLENNVTKEIIWFCKFTFSVTGIGIHFEFTFSKSETDKKLEDLETIRIIHKSLRETHIQAVNWSFKQGKLPGSLDPEKRAHYAQLVLDSEHAVPPTDRIPVAV